MKKTIITSIIFLLIGGICGYLLNPIINYKAVNSNEVVIEAPTPVVATDNLLVDEIEYENFKKSIGRIDYPLLDIYFDKDKNYSIVLTDFMGEKVYKKYKDNGIFFQFNKEYFSITTCDKHFSFFGLKK